MNKSIKVIIVGSLGAILFFCLLRFYLFLDINPLICGILTYIICFVCVYTAQRFWSFKDDKPNNNSLYRYAIVQVICAILASLLTAIFAHLEWNETFISGAVTVITSSFGFVGTRFWAFM
ncbi:GtrA family protein [Bartonella sp. HY038]|uniref:GtrA family protein n=1 Tax=Bartonella sp. HY038 TaxID=2759660 RepID=UPI0015FBDAA6|nr:GtrA family protein [Bartonella sp. HY038]